MSKIIKPKVNEKGEPVIDFVKKGDWYFTYGDTLRNFAEWIPANPSIDKVPIYYAEEWRPKVNENYWYCRLHSIGCLSTQYMPSVSNDDKLRISAGNCFQTQAEAEDVNNILKVLDNMKKYYEGKLTEVKNE